MATQVIRGKIEFMGFHHVLRVPSEIGTEKIRFIELPLKNREQIYIGSIAAVIEFNGEKYEIRVNFPSYMMEYLVKEKSEAKAGDEFVILAAEGEDLPYEKPDCILTKR